VPSRRQLRDLDAAPCLPRGADDAKPMSCGRGLLLTALCLALAACGTAAPPHRQREPKRTASHPAAPARGATSAAKPPKVATIIGLGDNETAFLTDPRFLALGITLVRDEIPWNALLVPFDRMRLTRWLDAARREHLTPLITFDRAAPPLRHTLPSVAEFSALFRELRARFLWVTQFVTWNESNYYGEPTATHPRRVARYYLALRADCPECTIVAPDLLDITDRRYAVEEVRWAHEFIRAAGLQPPIWALNDYVGANGLSTATIERLLRAVSGRIWIAETAGIISEPNHAQAASAANLRHQAAVDRFIVGRIARLSPRIQRVYLYEWQASSPLQGWDSALISWNGVPRPAYYALAQGLAASGTAPDCAVSKLPPACARR